MGRRSKASLIDPPTAKWLVSEYGVSEIATNGGSVSRTRKHALVIRTCQCGRKIAGNPYFRHVRACRSAGAAARGDLSNTLEPGSAGARMQPIVIVQVNVGIGFPAPVLKTGVWA